MCLKLADWLSCSSAVGRPTQRPKAERTPAAPTAPSWQAHRPRRMRRATSAVARLAALGAALPATANRPRQSAASSLVCHEQPSQQSGELCRAAIAGSLWGKSEGKACKPRHRINRRVEIPKTYAETTMASVIFEEDQTFAMQSTHDIHRMSSLRAIAEIRLCLAFQHLFNPQTEVFSRRMFS